MVHMLSLPVVKKTSSLTFPLAVTPAIEHHLRAGAVVALGVSGGKDSSAMVVATLDYLETIRHTGPRILCHSDLGRIEWNDSLPMCEQLAKRYGLELLVVHTDMIGRWYKRYANNVQRYQDLLCVKLIMPWSSSKLKFCTSDSKVTPITTALTRRFPENVILSASGIRRQESDQRKNAPIAKEQPRLFRKKLHTSGYDWHPILDWTLQDVYDYHAQKELVWHPAYNCGCSRVSCSFCVLSSQHNLRVAAGWEENVDVYRELVQLEIASTFSFQSGAYLGDVAPHLLSHEMYTALQDAKRRAILREQAEKRIPPHLWYQKGWPHVLPTQEEATLLADVRNIVAKTCYLTLQYRTADDIRDQYARLLKQKGEKERTARTKKRRNEHGIVL